MTRPPTPNEGDCYQAVKRLGSFPLAAAELGMGVGSVHSAVRIYMVKTGAPRPTGKPPRGARGTGSTATRVRRGQLVDGIPERLDAIEAAVADLVLRIDRLASESFVLSGLIEAFTARQPILLMPGQAALLPTHRRIADGGAGGRREARG